MNHTLNFTADPVDDLMVVIRGVGNISVIREINNTGFSCKTVFACNGQARTEVNEVQSRDLRCSLDSPADGGGMLIASIDDGELLAISVTRK